MSWFRLEASFTRHRKVRRLAKILRVQIATARGLVTGLFCAVCAESPDGSLADWDDVDIAYACDWGGDPATLVAALHEVRFIVVQNGEPCINDWMEYAEGHKNAQRQRRFRERKRALAQLDADPESQVRLLAVRNVTRNVTTTSTDGRTDGQTTQGEVQETIAKNVKPGADAPGVGFQFRLTEPNPAPNQSPDSVQNVWRHYRGYHPRIAERLKSNRKEYRLIRERLEDYPADDLKAAIDGYHQSPFHNGQNDRNRRYLSLELILRTVSHVQQGLELLDAKSNGAGGRASRPLDLTALGGDTEH